MEKKLKFPFKTMFISETVFKNKGGGFSIKELFGDISDDLITNMKIVWSKPNKE